MVSRVQVSRLASYMVQHLEVALLSGGGCTAGFPSRFLNGLHHLGWLFCGGGGRSAAKPVILTSTFDKLHIFLLGCAKNHLLYMNTLHYETLLL